MKIVDLRRRRAIVVGTFVCVSMCALLSSCAPRGADPGHSAYEYSFDAAMECEAGLRSLDIWIADRGAAGDVSPALVEARELRAQAAELYLRSSFDLALELISEAISLLRMPQP